MERGIFRLHSAAVEGVTVCLPLSDFESDGRFVPELIAPPFVHINAGRP